MKNLIMDSLTADSGFYLAYRTEIASFRTGYQDMKVVDTDSFGICLFLDGKIQSAQRDEFIYHESLVHPVMLTSPKPSSVFIAGGGEGATLREVLRHSDVQRVVMVDLDEEVVKICREHLPSWHQGAFDDPRLTLFHRDARAFLEEVPDRYDVIILDLPEPVDEGPSYLLFTREFYLLCRDRLHPGGVVVTQAGCSSPINPVTFHSVSMTMEQAFDRVTPFETFVPSFGSTWGMVMASAGRTPDEIPAGELKRRMSELNSGLRFLDRDFFPAALSLPRYHREGRERTGRVISDGKPLMVR